LAARLQALSLEALTVPPCARSAMTGMVEQAIQVQRDVLTSIAVPPAEATLSANLACWRVVICSWARF
jgi:hypothetical protein